MNKITQIFGLDLRSLATLRMGVALLIIFDLIARFGDLTAHYTDQGVLPRNAVQKIAVNFWTAYPHFISGELWFQGLLFILAGAFAVLLLLGYKTKVAAAASWFLLISLHTRNPVILSGGDLLLRLILFWGMFLQWEKRFSLDALSHSDVTSKKNTVFSSATMAYIMQIVVMYWMSDLLRSGPEWRTEGSALYYMLNSDQLTTTLGSHLLNFPQFLKWSTFSSLILQAVAPILIISPLFTSVLKTSAILTLALMHVGHALIFSIGNFHVVAIVALAGMLPSGFWNLTSSWWNPPDKSPHLLEYPMVLSRRLRKFLNPSRWVQYPTEGWRDKMLGYVKFMLPNRRPENAQTGYYPGKTINVLVALLLLYVVFWNIGSLPGKRGWLPEKIRFIGYILRLDQEWNSFAPSPSRIDGWYVMPGTLQNGEIVNTFNGMPHDGTGLGAENTVYHPKNVYWKKYFLNYLHVPDLRPYYGDYACALWNNNHGPQEKLKTFDVFSVQKETLPNYQIPSREFIFIWRYYCV